MILNTLGEKTQEIVKGNGKTVYQVWKLLEKSFTKSKESRNTSGNSRMPYMV